MPIVITATEPAEIISALHGENSEHADLTAGFGQREVEFPNLNHLTAEQAAALQQRRGVLSLPNLQKIESVEAAKKLGQHIGLLKMHKLVLDTDNIAVALAQTRAANGNQPLEINLLNLDLDPPNRNCFLPLLNLDFQNDKLIQVFCWVEEDVFERLDPYLNNWDLTPAMAVAPEALRRIVQANKLSAINLSMLNQGDGENWEELDEMPSHATLTIICEGESVNDDDLENLTLIFCSILLPDLDGLSDEQVKFLFETRYNNGCATDAQHLNQMWEELIAPSPIYRHYKNQKTLLESFNSQHYLWKSFLKRFDAGRRRIGFYPAHGGCWQDAIPLSLLDAADLFVFVDSRDIPTEFIPNLADIPGEVANIRLFNSLPLNINEAAPLNPGPIHNAVFFQMEYEYSLRGEQISHSKRMDCLKITADWWAAFEELVLNQGMSVDALVLDTFGLVPAKEILACRHRELNLKTIYRTPRHNQAFGQNLSTLVNGAIETMPEDPHFLGGYFADIDAEVVDQFQIVHTPWQLLDSAIWQA